jgi:hypothetical protein
VNIGLLPSWSPGWRSPPRHGTTYQSKWCHNHANHNTHVKGKVNFVTDKAKETKYVALEDTVFKITVLNEIFKFQAYRIVKIKIFKKLRTGLQ